MSLLDLRELSDKYNENLNSLSEQENFYNLGQCGERIMYSLHAFLSSYALLSKLLWGSSKEQQKNRKFLRDKFEIDDLNILKNRQLRNDFEHIDERIERRSRKKDHPEMAFVLGNINVDTLKKTNVLRSFNPFTGVIGFEQNFIEIGRIELEVRQLYSKVEPLLENPGVAITSWKSLL